jgi:PAS domain S-box-containing protein
MPSKYSRKKANKVENALAVMRAMLDATPDGIILTDQEGRITNWNTKSAEMWRMPNELVALRDIQKIRAFIAQQLKDASSRDQHHRYGRRYFR